MPQGMSSRGFSSADLSRPCLTYLSLPLSLPVLALQAGAKGDSFYEGDFRFWLDESMIERVHEVCSLPLQIIPLSPLLSIPSTLFSPQFLPHALWFVISFTSRLSRSLS